MDDIDWDAGRESEMRNFRDWVSEYAPAETLQIEPELAPTGGCLDDWPAWLMGSLLLVTVAGTAYVAVHG